jgi:hypothetical protein
MLHNFNTLVKPLYWRLKPKKEIVLLCGSLSPRHGASSGCGWRRRPPDIEELWIYWISSGAQPTRGGLPAWRLGEGVITTYRKKNFHCETLHKASELVGSCETGNKSWVSTKGGEFFWPAEWLLASEEGLCSMESVNITNMIAKLPNASLLVISSQKFVRPPCWYCWPLWLRSSKTEKSPVVWVHTKFH